MKRIIFSLFSILVLVMMVLPVTAQAVTVTSPAMTEDKLPPPSSSCSINITTNPGTGALVYLYDFTRGNGTYSDTDPGWISNGDHTESLNIGVTCGHYYQVWVTKPGWVYTVQSLTGGASTWCCEDTPLAAGWAMGGTYNIHFGGIDVGEPEPNPELEATCGLDIVLVMDESDSIDEDEFELMQDAFVDFVDALLPETPTELALVDFATLAHLRQDFTDNATTINNAINQPRLDSIACTNWEQALITAHGLFPNRGNPDLIIFASDGNPNAYGDPPTTGVNPATQAAVLTMAIGAANDIKNDGIRIITIGIGDGLDTDNLAAISSEDAVYTSDFDDLADELAALALELCGGTITVHKVIDEDGDLGTIDDQSDGVGWHFTATVDTPGSSTPSEGDTGSSGQINFDINFGGQGSATVDITETLDPCFELVDAVCTSASGSNGTFDDVDSIDDIVISPLDIVSCTFYNTPKDCDDGIDCTIDSCDPQTGQCTHTPDDSLCPADGWVDTDPLVTQWVEDTPCTEKEQKQQEWWNYYCDEVEGCTHEVTDTRWVDTGNTQNKADGTPCADSTFDDPVTYCKDGEVWEHTLEHYWECDNGVCTEKTRWIEDHLVETCDDEDLCTTDTCEDGVCVHTPIDCDDGDPCTIDTCVDGECVHTPVVSADFSADPTSGYAPLTVNFTDLSTGNPTSWEWDFDNDGNIDSTESEPPPYQYTSAGTYTVSLTVTNNEGCSDSDSMTVTVRVRVIRMGGGGGGGGIAECYLEVDMLGEITEVELNCCKNSPTEDCIAFDPDELHFLEIQEDTEIICGDCEGCRCYPRVLVMSLTEETPPAPDGKAIVAIYDFEGYKDTKRLTVCDEATFFDPPISMLLSYDPETLPEGAFSPVIAFYDAAQGLWVELPADTGRVAEVGKVTGLANRFASPFAVLVSLPPPPAPSLPPPPPAPAHFVVSGLYIAPPEIKVGENVIITVNVVNDGGQEGAYLVELKINGEIVDSEGVTLGAGQSEQVSFTLSGTEPGQYEVVISELSGEFTVLRTINWWLIGGIIAAIIILGSLGWYFRRRLG